MSARVPYDRIPWEVRRALDEVYKPEGVVIWWNAKHRNLGGGIPRDLWDDGDERLREVYRHGILTAAANLAGMVAT